MKIKRRKVDKKTGKRKKPLLKGRRLPWDREWHSSRTGEQGREGYRKTRQPNSKSVRSSMNAELQKLAQVLKRVSIEMDSHFEAAISARNLSIEARSIVAYPSRIRISRLLDACRNLLNYARWRIRDATARELADTLTRLSDILEKMPHRIYRLSATDR